MMSFQPARLRADRFTGPDGFVTGAVERRSHRWSAERQRSPKAARSTLTRSGAEPGLFSLEPFQGSAAVKLRHNKFRRVANQ